jgi:putative DNA primase/helicase
MGGDENGFMELWNTTKDAVELTALAHNDALLILDETRAAGDTDAEIAKVVFAVGFRLAGGKEKRRLAGFESPRSWRCFFLSTSNYSLAELAERGRRSIDVAARGRLVDIPLPGSGHGIYEVLHHFTSGDKLTDHLKAKCVRYYGAPIRQFLTTLAEYAATPDGRKDVGKWLSASRQKYLKELTKRSNGLSPSKRASNRFATVFAAGDLAIRFKILPWNVADLGRAVLGCQPDQLKLEAAHNGKKSSEVDSRSKLITYLREQKSGIYGFAKRLPTTEAAVRPKIHRSIIPRVHRYVQR